MSCWINSYQVKIYRAYLQLFYTHFTVISQSDPLSTAFLRNHVLHLQLMSSSQLLIFTSSSLRIVAASFVTKSFSKWLMTILFIPVQN